jgi:hypothetical protein
MRSSGKWPKIAVRNADSEASPRRTVIFPPSALNPDGPWWFGVLKNFKVIGGFSFHSLGRRTQTFMFRRIGFL